MSYLLPLRRLFATVALLSGVVVCEAQTNSAADAKVTATTAAKEKAATSAADVKKLLQQLSKEREGMIADHEALAKQLKDATDATRRAILEKMEAQKKVFEQATSELHKQIRDLQRRERASQGKK